MPGKINIEKVKDLREKLSKAKSVIVTEYHGLDVNSINEIRSKIRETGAEMVITKNTLIKVALKEEGMENEKMNEALKGPNATVLAYEDPVSPLKTIFEYAKTAELPKIKAGLVEGQYASDKELKVLSDLPGREQLIAQVVGGLKSPLSGFVNVLGGTTRSLVYVLSAISKEKEGSN